MMAEVGASRKALALTLPCWLSRRDREAQSGRGRDRETEIPTRREPEVKTKEAQVGSETDRDMVTERRR